MLPPGDISQFQRQIQTQVKGKKMTFQPKGIQSKAGVVVLKSDEIDFKIKKVKKITERHFIKIKGIMHQKDLTLSNIYAPNQEAPKYVKQLLTELKRETDKNTIVVGDLSTPLSYMDRSSKQ